MTGIKLSDFRIQNFRSIVDSGWCSLANDNITILIGQNESGKTSVLEALQSFHDKYIDEDVLRSDNTYPSISCKFIIEDKRKVVDFLNKKSLPRGLKKILEKQSEFCLTREWRSDKTNVVYISTGEIKQYFDKELSEQVEKDQKTRAEIKNVLEENDNLIAELEHSENEKHDAKELLFKKNKEVEIKQKQFKKSKKTDIKLIAENELIFAKRQYEEQEKEYTELANRCEETAIKLQKSSEKVNVARRYLEGYENLKFNKKSLKEIVDKISELEHLIGLCTHERDKNKMRQKLTEAKRELYDIKQKLKKNEREIKLNITIASKIFFDKLGFRQAETEANQEVSQNDKLLNMYQIGEVLFNSIPVFEFFEDFSGLLPNKVDLEDILNEHDNVEGYKAARNFLTIAGLDSSFFREKNQRILKQRIEALNHDVTIDFQDYWSQNVGKDNKIRLHFELEHYDYTIPEKSGKPYLEFWIKDKNERLYPKQRSRGVRWFLSFYLELKAAAVTNNKNRVLLIDEPGLSLHAKAQEDVLKVFEDLKEKMQIIYCTHSPHLVKTEKLYRILAVQRASETDDMSESLIFEPNKLENVTADTLTPIYSLMGVKLSNQNRISGNNSIVVPDTISYYYMNWLSKFFPDLSDVSFIPATGINTVPLLVNIMAAWQLNYGVILFGEGNNGLNSDLNERSLIKNSETNRLILLEKSDMVEDLFSTLDFKRFILLKRVGITEKNSEYIKINNLSRNILATNFINNFTEGGITLDELDEISRSNIKKLFGEIRKLLHK